jgi:hypothetical protein
MHKQSSKYQGYASTLAFRHARASASSLLLCSTVTASSAAIILAIAEASKLFVHDAIVSFTNDGPTLNSVMPHVGGSEAFKSRSTRQNVRERSGCRRSRHGGFVVVHQRQRHCECPFAQGRRLKCTGWSSQAKTQALAKAGRSAVEKQKADPAFAANPDVLSSVGTLLLF